MGIAPTSSPTPALPSPCDGAQQSHPPSPGAWPEPGTQKRRVPHCPRRGAMYLTAQESFVGPGPCTPVLGITPAHAACRSLGSTAKPSMVSHLPFLQDPIRVPRSPSGRSVARLCPWCAGGAHRARCGRARATSTLRRAQASRRQAGGATAPSRPGGQGAGQARRSTAGPHGQAGAATEDGLCACAGVRTLVRDLFFPQSTHIPRHSHTAPRQGTQAAGGPSNQAGPGRHAGTTAGKQAGRVQHERWRPAYA